MGNRSLFPCFICEEKIPNRGVPVQFSCEWDAYCHDKCCPAITKGIDLTPECKCCEIWLGVKDGS